MNPKEVSECFVSSNSCLAHHRVHQVHQVLQVHLAHRVHRVLRVHQALQVHQAPHHLHQAPHQAAVQAHHRHQAVQVHLHHPAVPARAGIFTFVKMSILIFYPKSQKNYIMRIVQV